MFFLPDGDYWVELTDDLLASSEGERWMDLLERFEPARPRRWSGDGRLAPARLRTSTMWRCSFKPANQAVSRMWKDRYHFRPMRQGPSDTADVLWFPVDPCPEGELIAPKSR
ncbi:MAG TPA: hypothetical protein VK691_07540 [Solirubrobacteraceae bacterium]|jgi:hypothetical protein|nr:hypothetical protein [Solirubrobacteraceae bacterium]